MAKVKIFTTPTCTYCNHAKDFFKENNVEFEAIDVTQDKAAAQEMVEKSGQRGVPVILIEGREEPLVGFDQDALEEALNL
ncbi:MAG TPA: glutaredoxin domain-containing protein [Candidatus Pacearchaeota archaeon]|jgi:glutaredoxin-like YruB-family protein|nr:NrdH-redoxin [Candidatus Pacearchaeota archaeon]HJO14735.1 glutaredoxin domain-containing protein [Candidatus Pacearchaeota archaeon]|tara:strand:+ start:1057 stop:1296 length:240 start_codon:yes stop_codon:yes gene_type:complete